MCACQCPPAHVDPRECVGILKERAHRQYLQSGETVVSLASDAPFAHTQHVKARHARASYDGAHKQSRRIRNEDARNLQTQSQGSRREDAVVRTRRCRCLAVRVRHVLHLSSTLDSIVYISSYSHSRAVASQRLQNHASHATTQLSQHHPSFQTLHPRNLHHTPTTILPRTSSPLCSAPHLPMLKSVHVNLVRTGSKSRFVWR